MSIYFFFPYRKNDQIRICIYSDEQYSIILLVFLKVFNSCLEVYRYRLFFFYNMLMIRYSIIAGVPQGFFNCQIFILHEIINDRTYVCYIKCSKCFEVIGHFLEFSFIGRHNNWLFEVFKVLISNEVSYSDRTTMCIRNIWFFNPNR